MGWPLQNVPDSLTLSLPLCLPHSLSLSLSNSVFLTPSPPTVRHSLTPSLPPDSPSPSLPHSPHSLAPSLPLTLPALHLPQSLTPSLTPSLPLTLTLPALRLPHSLTSLTPSPSPHSLTASLRRLPHSLTSLTLSLLHSLTLASLRHCLTPTLPHPRFTPSLHHSLAFRKPSGSVQLTAARSVRRAKGARWKAGAPPQKRRGAKHSARFPLISLPRARSL